ncbi:MAG: hypothetical protein V1708_03665 [Candidatus Micrarchaeota archaeon]
MAGSAFLGWEEITKLRSRKRRTAEIMVDCNGEDECDATMESYAVDCLQCPFEARMRGSGKGEKFRVLGVVCGEGGQIRCKADVRGAIVRIALLDIEPLSSAGTTNRRVIEDYQEYARGW